MASLYRIAYRQYLSVNILSIGRSSTHMDMFGDSCASEGGRERRSKQASSERLFQPRRQQRPEPLLSSGRQREQTSEKQTDSGCLPSWEWNREKRRAWHFRLSAERRKAPQQQASAHCRPRSLVKMFSEHTTLAKSNVFASTVCLTTPRCQRSIFDL